MITVDHVTPWFVRTLPLHGIREVEYRAYILILEEVAGTLAKPPTQWTKGDLRTFFAHRAPDLHHTDVVRYRRALGIIAEVLQRMPVPTRNAATPWPEELPSGPAPRREWPRTASEKRAAQWDQTPPPNSAGRLGNLAADSWPRSPSALRAAIDGQWQRAPSRPLATANFPRTPSGSWSEPPHEFGQPGASGQWSRPDSRLINHPENEIAGWDAPAPSSSAPEPFDFTPDPHRPWDSGPLETRAFGPARPKTGARPAPPRDDDDSILIVVDEDSGFRRSDDSSGLDITGRPPTALLSSDQAVAAFFGDEETALPQPPSDATPAFQRTKSRSKSMRTGEMAAVRRGTPAVPTAPVEQAEITTRVDDRGWLELTWTGFVAGQPLRDGLEGARFELARRGLAGILASMRSASVLGTDDTDWFGQWLNDCIQDGLRRLAIVSPANPTARLQLSRIVRELRSHWFTAPDSTDFAVEFFHHSLAARRWLEGN